MIPKYHDSDRNFIAMTTVYSANVYSLFHAEVDVIGDNAEGAIADNNTGMLIEEMSKYVGAEKSLLLDWQYEDGCMQLQPVKVPEDYEAPGFSQIVSSNQASKAEIEAAHDLYGEDGDFEVNVDNNAQRSEADDAVWVQVWVRVPNDHIRA
ncbi:hypothetical protein SAMN05216241_101540 [Limimonas halophila]|uniref:Uncharacterized protein n=1 Tax=Limimonas halophila TaxID=1082479 RepID=A0A1G7MAH0_9PROT|nr:hypothetical protein [Limimonas halophila]SDF58747.1 hypothetical protein SAMN05216241_101540 [Limimonas halophila]